MVEQERHSSAETRDRERARARAQGHWKMGVDAAERQTRKKELAPGRSLSREKV
jgi:hypothetical protein